VSRRQGHGAQDDPGDTEAEATVTTSAIAWLRRRLRRQGTFGHPAVRRELRKLEEQLAVFEQTGRSPGRHRAQASKPLSLDGVREASGSEDDLRAFAPAWERIASASDVGQGEGPVLLPASIPALRLAPGS